MTSGLSWSTTHRMMEGDKGNHDVLCRSRTSPKRRAVARRFKNKVSSSGSEIGADVARALQGGEDAV